MFLEKINYHLEYTVFIAYYSFYLGNMSNSEIYNIRKAGMKQETSDINNDFRKSLDNLKLDTNGKLNNINDQLETINQVLKKIWMI